MNTETQFNEDPKHGQVFCASGFCGSFEEYYSKEKKEISDEEIDKQAELIEVGIYRMFFKTGAKWYREQLKKRQ